MKIIIHGGFFTESHTNEATKIAKQNALKAIVSDAFEYLKTHSAAETVVYAVHLLENDILFNAGAGSQIQSDGKIRMSASLMNGATLKFSGVVNLEDVQNPIYVAQALMPYDDRVLGGEGALQFARNNGFAYFDPVIPQRKEEYLLKSSADAGKGTVGCVALDAAGNIACATSTGGKGFEMPGRISDSATVAGNYANQFCGVSMTGVGEDIVSGAMAAKIVTRVTDGMPLATAVNKTFEELKAIDGFAGAICIDNKGNIFHQDAHPTMVFASHDGNIIKCFE